MDSARAKERHLGPATLGDVADVLRPSLVSTRRILQIVGAWIGIGNLVALSSDLNHARKDEYYTNIILGMLITMGFAARALEISSS
jgi:hypothetical protein